MTTSFTTEVGRLMTRFNAPGLSVDMLTGGKRYSAHVGKLVEGLPHKVTRNARYATACLIKLLVAVEILSMAEKGLISLDAPIADYLPELAEGPRAKGRFIKVRHLLSHTGGYRSRPVAMLMPLAHESWSNCAQFLHDTDQLFIPGTVFDEDHLSYIILGQLIEKMTGKPALTAVAEHILKPLKIAPHTRPDDEKNTEIFAGGHAWDQEEKRWKSREEAYEEPDAVSSAMSYFSMSSGDVLRIGEALMDDYAGPGTEIITPFIRSNLFTEQVQLPPEYGPNNPSRWTVRAFGMGTATFRDGHRGCFTVGRGQNFSLAYDRTRKSAISLAMNTTNSLERNVMLDTLFAKFSGDSSIVRENRGLDIDFTAFMGPFTTRDLGGVYLGFFPDPVEIFGDPRGFTIRVDKKDGYRVEASEEGRLVIHTRLPMSIGVFQDPVSKGPCLSMGMHAFRKVN